jgi:hypothetical protein
MPKTFFDYLPLVIALLIVLRRSGRTQKVRMPRLWITPFLSAAAVGSFLAREPPPSLSALAIFIAAAALGAGAGYYRALHIELSVDSKSGEVMSKATPIGTVLIVATVLIRFGLDYAVNGGWRPGPPRFVQAPPHGVDIFRLADALMILTTVMSLAQRLEILRRAHALLKSERPKEILAS